MIPNLNRREALGVLGAIGAAAVDGLAGADEARAGHVEVGRYVKRVGVQGKMTGAQAAAAALCLRRRRAASSASPAPRTTSSGTP